MKNLKDKKFGRLLVKEQLLDRSKDGRIKWRCICDCGKTKTVNSRQLLSGNTSSCGCLKIEINKNTGSNSFTGVGELSSSYWANVKKGAEKRELEFSITIEYTWELLKKQEFKCALTGLPISCTRNYGKQPTLQTASLDRRDSSKGYVEGNVQWLHKIVNCMKNDWSNEEFIALCEMVDKHMKEVKNESN